MAAATRIYRRRYAREFLEAVEGGSSYALAKICRQDVVRYVEESARHLKPASMSVLAVSVRDFLRFSATGRRYNTRRLRLWPHAPYFLVSDRGTPLPRSHEDGVSPQTIRTVVHLHGASVLPRYDGYPTNWFLPGESDLYFYGNVDLNDDGQTLWYYDHAVGVTANNVYAGLAGLYLVRSDEYDAAAGIRLPSGPHEIPLVFQDRDFAVTTWEQDGVTHSATNLALGSPHHAAAPSGAAIDAALASTGATAPLAATNWHYHAVVSRIPLMPGERVDVVVDFTSYLTPATSRCGRS